MEKDYGYDLILRTYDEVGYIEPGAVYLQLKASESLDQTESGYFFDVDIRDYNLWMLERMPVFLILFDASRRRAFWIWIQGYFQDELSRRPKKGTKTVRVHVPGSQAVGRRAVRRMCQIKRDTYDQAGAIRGPS